MVRTYRYEEKVQLTPHFNTSQFKCKCGKPHDFKVSDELVQNLEKLYTELRCSAVSISSGFRCPDHDKAVGGKGNGKHTMGLAADCTFKNQNGVVISTKLISCKAQDIGFKGIANINTSYTYIHLDMRESGKWYSNEIHGNDNVTNDFYAYYGIPHDNAPIAEGIDISWCQPKVDWDKVKTDFAIIQIGGGYKERTEDVTYQSHYDNLKKKGIPVGAYWFIRALTEKDAEEEADICIGLLKNKQFEYPIFLDMETTDQFNLDKKTFSAIIRAFLKKVEAAGYWVGLYTNLSALNNLVEDDIKSRYTIWLAQWHVEKPTYTGAYGIWQPYKRPTPGFPEDVDYDYCYVDYPTKIKAKGLNGWGTQPEPPEPPKPEPKPDIKMGDKGDEVKWLQEQLVKKGTLRPNEVDGSFGRITRGAVLEFQMESGLPLTGICDEATRKALEQ